MTDPFVIHGDKKRLKRSPVWKFFRTQEPGYALCRICNGKLRTSGGSTRGLIAHLESRHVSAFYEFKEEKQRRITEGEGPYWSEEYLRNNEGDATEKYEQLLATHQERVNNERSDTKEVGSQDLLKCIREAIEKEVENVEKSASEEIAEQSTSSTTSTEQSEQDLIASIMSSHASKKEEHTVRERIRRSPVWKYFERNGPACAQCQLCKSILKTTRGSTRGLIAHLESRHVQALQEFRSEKKRLQEENTEIYLRNISSDVYKDFVKNAELEYERINDSNDTDDHDGMDMEEFEMKPNQALLDVLDRMKSSMNEPIIEKSKTIEVIHCRASPPTEERPSSSNDITESSTSDEYDRLGHFLASELKKISQENKILAEKYSLKAQELLVEMKRDYICFLENK